MALSRVLNKPLHSILMCVILLSVVALVRSSLLGQRISDDEKVLKRRHLTVTLPIDVV
jgi:hypothetical protein